MRSVRVLAAVALATGTFWTPQPARAAELTNAIPPEAHLFVIGWHNSERDYQTEYLRDAWETFQDERIGERLLDIVTSRMDADDLQKARDVWNELREAMSDVDFSALTEAEQVVVFQVMNGPVNQSTVVVELSESDATALEAGVVNVMELVAGKSNGKLPVKVERDGDATITKFDFPPEVPLQPAVGRKGGVLLLSTSDAQIRTALALLEDESPDTKYKDPRVVEALANLPEPEDTFVFFDGQMLFERLRGIPEFIRQQHPNKSEAERFARTFNAAIDEFAVIDYEATVEYTDGQQNRTAALGRITPDYKDHMLGRAMGNQQLFENWKSWVPADATAFSLNAGINLHEVYAGIVEFVAREFPEAEEGLQQFAEMQEQIGVHLDRDILQSFPGETVSVSFPVEGAPAGQPQSVTALRCTNPDKIKELMHRAVDNLKAIPALQGQNLDLVEADGLEGFEELKLNAFAMAQARPVIGFVDGWMVVASSPNAAEKFVAVRNGEEQSIASGDLLDGFDLESEGPVAAASYSDIGAAVRQAADFIDQLAAMAPMAIGMAAADASPEDLKPIQELVSLLPSFAKVVRKFDFYEQKLSITREGPLPLSYLRESVTLVRAPDTAAAN